MRRMTRRFRAIAICAAAALGSSCVLLQGYSAAPINGRIVAKDDGAPIPDALVVITWRLQTSAHETEAGLLYAAETRTDLSGQFHFDGWSDRRPSQGRLAAGMPELTIYRDGFAGRTVGNGVLPWTPGANGSVVRSEWDGRDVQLDSAASDLTVFHTQMGVLEDLFLPGRDNRCNWLKMPQATVIALDLGRYFTAHGVDNSFPTPKGLELSGCANRRAVPGGQT